MPSTSSSAATKCQTMLDQLLAYSRVQQKPLARVQQDAAPAWSLLVTRSAAAHAKRPAGFDRAPRRGLRRPPSCWPGFRTPHRQRDQIPSAGDKPADRRPRRSRRAALARADHRQRRRRRTVADREKAFGMFRRLSRQGRDRAASARALPICPPHCSPAWWRRPLSRPVRRAPASNWRLPRAANSDPRRLAEFECRAPDAARCR